MYEIEPRPPVSVQLYTHAADSIRSLTSKTELFHLPIDNAKLMRRRLGVDLPWVCVGPTKIVCGRVRTGPNRDVIRPITRFSLTHDATQRWRQSAVVGGHDHSLYPPTAADDISPSSISSVRFFDSADGVYSTSSAGELGNCRPPHTTTVDGATRVNNASRIGPSCASLAKGMDERFPSRPSASQAVSVAQPMLS